MPANDDEAQILDQWSHRLANALQLLDLDFDRELILDLAGNPRGPSPTQRRQSRR